MQGRKVDPNEVNVKARRGKTEETQESVAELLKELVVGSGVGVGLTTPRIYRQAWAGLDPPGPGLLPRIILCIFPSITITVDWACPWLSEHHQHPRPTMRWSSLLPLLLSLSSIFSSASFIRHTRTGLGISPQLFADLEELARIVDISYCVGLTGILPPFLCAGRCDEFPTFELIEVSHSLRTLHCRPQI